MVEASTVPHAPGLCASVSALLMVAACGGNGGSGGTASVPPPPAMQGPTVTSQADAILHMDQVRQAGFRGAGIRVGVISTGVVNLKSYQTAGVLPSTLYVSQNMAGTLDEGSWMLELVHQSAPDAELGFCDGVDLDFEGCIKDLANQFHADIVVDDILFSGQFYPDNTADTVAQLEQQNDRFVFIHLAGNEQNGGYWQGPFVPGQAAIGGSTLTVLDFGAASGGTSDNYNTLTLPAGALLRLILNWNDPPHGTANHALSAYLLNDALEVLTQASAQADPNIILNYTNSSGAALSVHLAVSLDGGGDSSGLAVQITEGSKTCNIECQRLSHSTSGLAGGSVGDFDDAVVVGSTSITAPIQLDPWTNRGPFRIDFAATADTAAADGYDYTRLPTPIQVRKPDVVAPDCVTTPFSDGTRLANNQFCGTSAAVPGVAATAALLESAGFHRTQVIKALRGTAVPLGGAGVGWDPGYGFGLVDAQAALKSGGN